MLSFINDEFTIVKLIGSKNAVDSINVDVIAFQGDAASRDSLLDALNSGLAFEEALKRPGVAGGQADIGRLSLQLPTTRLRIASSAQVATTSLPIRWEPTPASSA